MIFLAYLYLCLVFSAKIAFLQFECREDQYDSQIWPSVLQTQRILLIFIESIIFYLISNVASGWVSDLDLKSISNSFSFSQDSVPLFICVAWYQNRAFLLDLFL